VIGSIVSSITAGSTSLLRSKSLKLFFLFLSNSLVTWTDIALTSWFSESYCNRLKCKLFDKILHREMLYFDKYHSMEITAQINDDIKEMKSCVKQIVTRGLKTTTVIIGSVYSLFNLSQNLTFTMTTTLPGIYILMNYYGAYLRQLS